MVGRQQCIVLKGNEGLKWNSPGKSIAMGYCIRILA